MVEVYHDDTMYVAQICLDLYTCYVSNVVRFSSHQYTTALRHTATLRLSSYCRFYTQFTLAWSQHDARSTQHNFYWHAQHSGTFDTQHAPTFIVVTVVCHTTL